MIELKSTLWEMVNDIFEPDISQGADTTNYKRIIKHSSEKMLKRF